MFRVETAKQHIITDVDLNFRQIVHETDLQNGLSTNRETLFSIADECTIFI